MLSRHEKNLCIFLKKRHFFCTEPSIKTRRLKYIQKYELWSVVLTYFLIYFGVALSQNY